MITTLIAAAIVQFKDCFSQSSYLVGDPQTKKLMLHMLPNEQISLFEENNFCLRSDKLKATVQLNFLNTTDPPSGHKHTKISIGSDRLLGEYIYNFNKPITFEFDIHGIYIDIDDYPTVSLYDSIYNVTFVSYEILFDNAGIDGTI